MKPIGHYTTCLTAPSRDGSPALESRRPYYAIRRLPANIPRLNAETHVQILMPASIGWHWLNVNLNETTATEVPPVIDPDTIPLSERLFEVKYEAGPEIRDLLDGTHNRVAYYGQRLADDDPRWPDLERRGIRNCHPSALRPGESTVRQSSAIGGQYGALVTITRWY